MPLFVFMVPKSAQGWPLIASSAGRPDCLSRLASASHDGAEVSLRRATDLVQRIADLLWLRGPGAAGKGRLQRQEDVVRVIGEKRCHEGEVVGEIETRVGAGDAARGRDDGVGLGGHAGDGASRPPCRR